VSIAANAAGTVSVHALPAEWRTISKIRGLIDVAWIWGGIITTVACCAWVGGFWIHVAGFVVVGVLQNNMSSLTHHAIHSNLYPTRAVNDAIARFLLAAPMAQLFSVLRAEHLHHHAHLGDADDPERYYYDLELHGRRTSARFVRWVASLFLGWVVIGVVRRTLTGSREGQQLQERRSFNARAERERRIDTMIIPPMQILLLFLMWAIHGEWWAYFFLWALPAATVGGGLTVLRATLDHADAGEPPDLALTFVSNPIERFIVSPFNFNYHFEHHYFMTVPYYHAPKLRVALLERGELARAQVIPSYAGRLKQLAQQLRAAERNC
jgi:fatty acid desaturase